MGTSNYKLGLEQRLARLKGELKDIRSEVGSIESTLTRLPSLHQRASAVETAITHLESLLQFDYPDWRSEKVKPITPRVWKSPFKPGEIGRTALTVLRENGGWMRPIEVAREMLRRIGSEDTDRVAREKLTNSVGGYFIKHKGRLVESRGDFAKEWRVIR